MASGISATVASDRGWESMTNIDANASSMGASWHQVRRADGSSAQDHLPAGPHVDDLAVFEQPHTSDAVLRGGPGTATLMVANLIVHQQL